MKYRSLGRRENALTGTLIYHKRTENERILIIILFILYFMGERYGVVGS
jgi:hypothetical protein